MCTLKIIPKGGDAEWGGDSVWISKKKWQLLEKRVTDLEARVQNQPIRLSENIKVQLSDSDIGVLAEELKKAVANLFE